MSTCKWSLVYCIRRILLTSYSFAFSDGFNSSPLPFDCSITPRSERHARIVEREFQEARGELQKYTVAAN
jgi:hypothetical protein